MKILKQRADGFALFVEFKTTAISNHYWRKIASRQIEDTSFWRSHGDHQTLYRLMMYRNFWNNRNKCDNQHWFLWLKIPVSEKYTSDIDLRTVSLRILFNRLDLVNFDYWYKKYKCKLFTVEISERREELALFKRLNVQSRKCFNIVIHILHLPLNDLRWGNFSGKKIWRIS